MGFIVSIMGIELAFEEGKTAHAMALALRTARIEAKQTQDELAARMGVSRWTIAAMEKGDAKVSLAAWLKASALLELLDTWGAVMEKEEDPFVKYDREQAKKQKLSKTRVRK